MTVWAQLLTFGATGGFSTQTPLAGTGDRTPFVLGPTVNIRILSHLSLETGVLFTRMGRSTQDSIFIINTGTRQYDELRHARVLQ